MDFLADKPILLLDFGRRAEPESMFRDSAHALLLYVPLLT